MVREMMGWALATTLVSAAGYAQAPQEGKPAKQSKKGGGGEAAHAAMMEAWQQASMVGEQHAKLKTWVGKWTTSVKMWMDPSQPPQQSTGTSEFKSILGDRFVQEDARGTFMNQPFQGIGITGYDNVKKKFVSTWVDNMGTMIMMSEGKADATGKTLTMVSAPYEDPATQKKTTSRIVLHIDSDSRRTMEMYSKPAGGKEIKVLEIVYSKENVG